MFQKCSPKLMFLKWFYFQKDSHDSSHLKLILKVKFRHSWTDVKASQLCLALYVTKTVLVVTISFWSWPNHYGQVQINLVRPKPFWTDQNSFGRIEGQGISDICGFPWSFSGCSWLGLSKCTFFSKLFFDMILLESNRLFFHDLFLD